MDYCPAYYEMGFIYRNPDKILRHIGETDAENCVLVIVTMAPDILMFAWSYTRKVTEQNR